MSKEILENIIKNAETNISTNVYISILKECEENGYTSEEDIKRVFDRENKKFSENMTIAKEFLDKNNVKSSLAVIKAIIDRSYLDGISIEESCKFALDRHDRYIDIMLGRKTLKD